MEYRKKELNKYLIPDITDIILKYYQKVHCQICYNDLYGQCICCEAENKQDCILIGLQCGHKFHQCCIFRWMKTRGSCPLDDIDIEFVSN